MQTVSESMIRKEYQIKVNECIENMQQAIENSFNNIDTKLDELLNNEFNSINIIASQQQQSQLPKINSNILFKFQDDNFPKQICQEVTSLMLINTHNQVQKQEQQYQELTKETHTTQKNQINQNDCQINTQTIQQSSTLQTTQSNVKPFTYQLVKENSIKQDQWCNAIAVNKDCSILIAGCESQIKVFEVIQGILKQVQILSEHGRDVYTLNFMKRSDHFISGSQDKSIIIWARDQNNLWICQQYLNGHTNGIYCLQLNDNENIIISGGWDNKIKFWQKQNTWLCTQTIRDHKNAVLGLTLNEQLNRLISCGSDNFILVIDHIDLFNKWVVKQKIKVEQCGFRLCFIDNYTFTFYPDSRQYIIVFEINNINNQYTKTKEIPVKGGSDHCLFASQYIESKCMLVNKNGLNVSLISMKQNGEVMTQESIEFGTSHIFGYMTDDGQYLITWDDQSKEIQIRKYQEK
ncbi:unnamed protein product [Paramecium primaurelia]|uniref:Uncharacterized protein n=1 Tax=Paramecium primaurelia TaxID=5886 RepID=A0A8S1QUH7_PARPR|nr:unnamed protein product [Paramecium primaurelia]